jgi:hypothetical protein
MSDTTSPIKCPQADEWLQWVCNAREDDVVARRTDLQDHLDGCLHCQRTVDEVRRYQTWLLRSKAPVLSPEGRATVDERIRVLSGQWSPPPRVSPRLAWGIALAVAAVLVFALGRPLVSKRAEAHRDFQDRIEEARQTGTRGKGLQTGAVEAVEVAGQDGAWKAMVAGTLLEGGMKLRAPAGRTGRVVVPGRFELTLAQGSEVEIIGMGALDAWLRLADGAVECQVQKLQAGQRFSVMFAGFRASVVGTRFIVKHPRADNAVAVVVSEGAVRVDAADDPGQPLAETLTIVRAGQQWQHTAGRMSLEPIGPLIQDPAAMVAAPVAVPAAESVAVSAQAAPIAVVHPFARPAVLPPLAPATITGATGPLAAPLPPPHVRSDQKNILIEVPHQQMDPPADDAK